MPDFFRRTALLPGTAYVVSSDAPAATRRMALIEKARFGALIQICDGVADQVEIQAAIDALPADGGKVVLTEGLFTTSATINLRHGTQLEGTGITVTTIALANNSNCDVIAFIQNQARASFVHLANLSIGGNKANQANGRGVYMSSVAPATTVMDVTIERVWVSSAKEQGFLISPNSWGTRIYDCLAEFCGGNGFELAIANQSYISKCYSSEGGAWGFYCVGTDVLFEGCVAANNVNGYMVGSLRAKAVGCNAYGPTPIVGGRGFQSGGTATIFMGCVSENYLWGFYLAPYTESLVVGCTVSGTIGVEVRPLVGRATILACDFAATTQAFSNSPQLAFYFNGKADIFMDVLAVSATHVRSNEDLGAATPITFTIDAQPDVPRTLSGHFDSHAQITAYTIVITGVDAKGNTVTETFTETASPWDFETVNAYATITSIIMTTRTGTGVGDTMDIGITDVLGLSNKIYATTDVYKIKKNNANALVAVAQVNATYGTYDMAVIGLAVGDDFTIWFRSNLNIVS